MSNALPILATQRRISVARDKQSYKNIGYLLCSFFLGLFYFIVIVPGILLGIGTLIIWLGVPILFAVMWLWWLFAAFERRRFGFGDDYRAFFCTGGSDYGCR